VQHSCHAGHLRGGLCCGAGISAGDEDMDIAADLPGSGNGMERGGLEWS
jgi:hypothetical protein